MFCNTLHLSDSPHPSSCEEADEVGPQHVDVTAHWQPADKQKTLQKIKIQKIWNIKI